MIVLLAIVGCIMIGAATRVATSSLQRRRMAAELRGGLVDTL